MREYFKGVFSVKEQLLFFKSELTNPSFGEKVLIRWGEKEVAGQVIEVTEKFTLIEVLGDSSGLSKNTLVRFTGKPFTVKVSKEMIGKSFNAYGEGVFGEEVEIHGKPINPFYRDYPKEILITGISSIDGLNTLVKGQKLPIFAVSGVETEELVIRLVNQIQGENTLTVLGAIGLKNETVDRLLSEIKGNVVSFISKASEPSAVHILLPRTALSVSEYFAFKEGIDVVTVLYDMTNYCDALREISSKRDEIPGRKGYPAYLYSDLASIYERAGIIKGRKGSLTLIPVLTMPDDDITHPIPDLTGYITEGQIVLSRELYQQGIFPPVDVLSSLSRLMKDAVTSFHKRFSSQLFSSYSRFKTVLKLSSIVGEEELGETEKRYLKFGKKFLKTFINQGREEVRTLEETFRLGWKSLSLLPERELTQLREEDIEKLRREFGQEQN